METPRWIKAAALAVGLTAGETTEAAAQEINSPATGETTHQTTEEEISSQRPHIRLGGSHMTPNQLVEQLRARQHEAQQPPIETPETNRDPIEEVPTAETITRYQIVSIGDERFLENASGQRVTLRDAQGKSIRLASADAPQQFEVDFNGSWLLVERFVPTQTLEQTLIAVPVGYEAIIRNNQLIVQPIGTPAPEQTFDFTK